MLARILRYKNDLLVALGLAVATGGLCLLRDWSLPATLLAALIVLVGLAYLLRAIRESAARTRLALLAQGDTLHQQAEFAMELRRMLEPRAILPASRGWAGSPDLLATICDLIQQHRPQVLVECGAGLSTITNGLALERFGAEGATMLTLEHDEAWANESRRRVEQHGLGGRSTIVHAPLVDREVAGATRRWYDTSGVDLPERIDFLVIDGPPRESADLARYPAGPLLHDRLAPGAIIVLDDANRPEERTAVERWIADLGWRRLDQVVRTEKGITILQRP